jgi:hypothetical protein
MVLSCGVGLDDIRKIWPHGHVIHHNDLYSAPDFRQLAEYLIKQTNDRFRDDNEVYHRRYSPSRTIELPETRREEVDESELETPKIQAGWFIDKDSYYEGFNPVTGQMYNEYVLLPIDADSKYKKWNRMKKTRPAPDGTAAWLRKNLEYQYEMSLDEMTEA